MCSRKSTRNCKKSENLWCLNQDLPFRPSLQLKELETNPSEFSQEHSVTSFPIGLGHLSYWKGQDVNIFHTIAAAKFLSGQEMGGGGALLPRSPYWWDVVSTLHVVLLWHRLLLFQLVRWDFHTGRAKPRRPDGTIPFLSPYSTKCSQSRGINGREIPHWTHSILQRCDLEIFPTGRKGP